MVEFDGQLGGNTWFNGINVLVPATSSLGEGTVFVAVSVWCRLKERKFDVNTKA